MSHTTQDLDLEPMMLSVHSFLVQQDLCDKLHGVLYEIVQVIAKLYKRKEKKNPFRREENLLIKYDMVYPSGIIPLDGTAFFPD